MPDELDERYAPETLNELGKLAIRLSRNPKTRRGLLKMVKATDPNYQLPGDMQVQDLRDELAGQRERERIEAEGKAIRQKLEDQRARLGTGELVGRAFDDAQIADIEKVMTKYGVGDYEAGAKIYLADAKPARPTPAQSGPAWTFPDLPGLLDDPAKAARAAAFGVIDELQGRR
jgi:hypothetical protein